MGMLAVRAQSRALRRVTGRSYQGWSPTRGRSSGWSHPGNRGRRRRGGKPGCIGGVRVPCRARPGAVSHAAVPNPICGASDWGPPGPHSACSAGDRSYDRLQSRDGRVTPVPANDRRPSHADTAVARPVRVGLLGPVSIQVDGRDIGIGGARRRSALALLSLAGCAGMSATSLAGAMFGDDVDARTLNTLQVGSAVPRGCQKALTRAPGRGPASANVLRCHGIRRWAPVAVRCRSTSRTRAGAGGSGSGRPRCCACSRSRSRSGPR